MIETCVPEVSLDERLKHGPSEGFLKDLRKRKHFMSFMHRKEIEDKIRALQALGLPVINEYAGVVTIDFSYEPRCI